MRSPATLMGLAVILASSCHGAGLPADAAVNEAAPNKTLVPKVVVNSGRLGWEPHTRDLTKWLTLSYGDHRGIPRPRKVELKLPLAGDAARGKTLLWEWCVACHQVPDDQWPGTVGTSLLHYQRYKNPDGAIFQQIFDARVFNPNTVMPPFGTFGLLSEQDIRDLVAYLQSIE